MNAEMRKKITIVFGLVMLVAMSATVVIPIFQQNISQSATTSDTSSNNQPSGVPTFPPPVVDFNAINFNTSYRHPSGLFSVAELDGWTVVNPVTDAGAAEVTMSNRDNLSVIQATVRTPEQPIATLDELGAYFSQDALAASWTNYSSWHELDRQVVGDRLQIDFRLDRFGQTYIARQVSWLDASGYVDSVRVVAPENASELLRFLADRVPGTLQNNDVFAGTPADWTAYFDDQVHHAIRYPADWVVTDSAPGLPASISSADSDTALRVEAAAAESIADADAASAWVTSSRVSANVLSVEPIDRAGVQGFSVAYSYTNADGDPYSGIAVLLNGPNDTLHVADLSFYGASVDLNSADAQSNYGDLAEVVRSFAVLPAAQ